jgi:hypothetical protein
VRVRGGRGERHEQEAQERAAHKDRDDIRLWRCEVQVKARRTGASAVEATT